MASRGWALFLCCLAACIIISQSSTCSHAQCDYDYVNAKADCSSLNLDCIPVNYPDARIMDLSHNSISELAPDDFNGTFSGLVELYLDYNNISDVTSLMGSTGMDSLKKLSVQRNVISDLPYTCQLSSLTDLLVDYNAITYLSSIPQCVALRLFSADFNSINYVSYYLFDYTVFPQIIISLQFNQLISFDVYFDYFIFNGFKNLTLLLDHNDICCIYIDSPVNTSILNRLSLSFNRLQYLYTYPTPIALNLDSNGLRQWEGIYRHYYRSGNAIKILHISNNSFDSLIQPDWAEDLEFLNANNNMLANLSSTTLSGFYELTELHVANNHLLFITPSALSQLSLLQSLYLDDNALTSLFGGVFFNQSNLVELSMTNNLLTMLHPDYFIGLVSLERLYLAGNQLTSANPQMFRLMTQIMSIDLSRNELQLFDLEDCALYNLTNLRNLSLAHNSILDAVSILGYCDNLEILDLSFNQIQVVSGESLSGRIRALSKLELEGNPLQCDCRLTGLRDWLRNNPPYVDPRCEGPTQHSGSLITDLDIRDFSCEPPKIVTDNSNLSVIIGQTATLGCTATGIPTPNITWLYPNGTEISDKWQGRFAILRNNILLITPVGKSDQGIFTCLAENVLGEMGRAVVNVTVTSRPTEEMTVSLAASVLPTMVVTIAITLAVVALVIFLRRRYTKYDRATKSTSPLSKTSDVKVGFRKGENTHSDGGYINEVQDEDYETPTGIKQTKLGGYEVGPGNLSSPAYEVATEGSREEAKDEEVYETVSLSRLD